MSVASRRTTPLILGMHSCTQRLRCSFAVSRWSRGALHSQGVPGASPICGGRGLVRCEMSAGARGPAGADGAGETFVVDDAEVAMRYLLMAGEPFRETPYFN